MLIENQDPENVGTGEVISFSILDYLAGGEEIYCSSENVPIINNDITLLSVERTFNYQGVEIINESLPDAIPGIEYEYQLNAVNGNPPYVWSQILEYGETEMSGDFPEIEGLELIPSNYDDGFAEVDLDFSFPFYTEEFDHLLISTDGSILFGESFQYIRSEANIKNAMTISPYCADLMLYPEQGDGIWYSGDEEQATFHWLTSLYSQPEVNIEFLATIYATGEIEFQLNGATITPSQNWASGISRGDHLSYTIADISGSLIIPEDYYSTFTRPDFPEGFHLTEEGLFTGITNIQNGSWDLTFRVTDDNYIFTEKTVSFATSSTSAGETDLPRIISLENYPNPFNPSTTISFQLTGDGDQKDVELAIFNIKGQKLKKYTISNIQYSISNNKYSITWDGTDENLEPVTSGIYFYKLKSGNQEMTRKMLLLK